MNHSVQCGRLQYTFSLFCPVKHPFIKYQLALAFVECESHSEVKSVKVPDNLLTPEGLGLPEKTFSDLQVSAVHSHILPDGQPTHI